MGTYLGLPLARREYVSFSAFANSRGDGITDNSTAFDDAAHSNYKHIVVPEADPGASYNMNDSVELVTTGQRWDFPGESGHIFQNLTYRPQFVFTAEDVEFNDISYGHPGTRPQRSAWTATKFSTAVNNALMQDSTISRSAGLYVMASGTKLRRPRARNVFSSIRIRPLERYQTLADLTNYLWNVELLYPDFEHFQMGVLPMGCVNSKFLYGRSRFTDAIDSTPPHVWYNSGNGRVPRDIIVPGVPDLDGDGTSDLPTEGTGQADAPMVNCVLDGWLDEFNEFSTSFKVRNWYGGRVGPNMESRDCARSMEISWCEGLNLVLPTARQSRQARSASTGLLVASGTLSIVQFNYCSHMDVEGGQLHSDTGFHNGVTFRNACKEIRLREGSVWLDNAGAGFSPYKAVGCSDIVWEENAYELTGAFQTPYAFTDCDNTKVIRPRGRLGNAAWTGVVSWDATSDNNELVLDPKEYQGAVPSRATAVVSNAGTGNIVTVPGDDAGLAHSAVETAPTLMGSGSTLALTGQLAKGARFVPTKDFPATRIRLEVTTIDAANTQCIGAIMEAGTGKILAKSTSQTVFDAVGEREVTFTAVDLKKGVGYVAWVVNPSATSAAVVRSSTLSSSIVANYGTKNAVADASNNGDGEYQHKAGVTDFPAVGATFTGMSLRPDAPILAIAT